MPPTWANVWEAGASAKNAAAAAWISNRRLIPDLLDRLWGRPTEATGRPGANNRPHARVESRTLNYTGTPCPGKRFLSTRGPSPRSIFGVDFRPGPIQNGG